MAYSVSATKAAGAVGFRTETAADALEGVQALHEAGFTTIRIQNFETEVECTEADLAQVAATEPDPQMTDAAPRSGGDKSGSVASSSCAR